MFKMDTTASTGATSRIQLIKMQIGLGRNNCKQQFSMGEKLTHQSS